MQQKRQIASGKHRKRNSNIKGRVAVVAAATGVVSTAGATGAAVAHTSSSEEPAIALASDSATLPENVSAPQILAIAEFKPAVNLADQLTKAIEYAGERAEADKEARKPKVSVAKPAEGAFTSGFGPRWGTFHAGIDIANAVGTPILAVMDGTVIDSGPASGYGNWIRIQHNDGSISVYGHMETLNVAVGELVKAGQVIAGMGNRGFSTGSHLHFEIHPNGQGAVDPAAWLSSRGISL